MKGDTGSKVPPGEERKLRRFVVERERICDRAKD
jgi:hypothetical protein